ncbi:MAG: ATP-binding protein [Planctomycetes bacterium]|nr:ATP-binding protein [Planctomycetota bacterium]
MNLSDTQFEHLLKRLHLAFLRHNWRALLDRAEREQWSYRDVLTVAISEEVAHRVQTGIARRTRAARLPFLKTIDDFNFTFQSTLRLQMLGSFLSPDFVTDGRNVIFHGKPGRGKTHLAVAIAYRAIQNGFDALFVNAAELIDDLSRASEAGRFKQRLHDFVQPAVLVIDEVGYLTLGQNAANVLYHVVNTRYLKRKPMIFTTNKSLTAWGDVLHDPDLAAAILDRVLEHGRLIALDGPSIRDPNANLDSTDLIADDKPAKISGKQRPKFPEPAQRIAFREENLPYEVGEILADLATDLDFYDPDPRARREDPIFFDEDRAFREIRHGLERIRSETAQD